MYDQSTLDLIKQGPGFGKIDLEIIPKELTDGYATIVSSRIRLNTDFHSPVSRNNRA